MATQPIGARISTIQNLLKDLYLPPVVEQLQNDIYFLSQIEKVTDFQIVGNQVVVPLHTARTGGIGSRGELIVLPDPGNQSWAKALFDLSYHYGRGQVSGVAMAKTKNEAGSFLEVLKSEMDFIRNDLKKDMARQVWGPSDGNTGGNGRIAQCGTTSSSTTVVLNSAEPLRKGHIYQNMVIDIGTSADADAVAAGRTVQSVNVSGPSIVISGAAVTTSTSHFISRAGNAIDSSAGYEMTGLQDLVATTNNTVGGINSSTAGNEYWRPIRDTAGGALTIDNMQKIWNQVVLSGGGPPELILTTYGLQRAYFNLLQAQVRYLNPMELKSGYTALDFNNRPLVADPDAKFGSIFFLVLGQFKNFTNRDWGFLDDDGDVLKWVRDYDAWEFVLAMYNQIGINRRNNQAVMSGLTDSTGF